MDHAEVQSALFGAVDELEEAAGVGGGDDGCAGGLDVVEFALEELVGHFRLDEVVDAGGASQEVERILLSLRWSKRF